MMKMSAIAVLGLLALTSGARAASETPAFVNATMCDVAAPISSGATIFSRKVRAEIRVAKRPAAQSQHRRAPAAAQLAPRRPIEREAAVNPDASAPEADALLYPAVHFCVTPGGAANPVRYT